MFGQEVNIEKEKFAKLERMVKELLKKYQIEILQPKLDYVIEKFKTAYEHY